MSQQPAGLTTGGSRSSRMDSPCTMGHSWRWTRPSSLPWPALGNPADRAATPAPPPYGQQDKLKNAHTQNLCGETVVAWSFWPWKSEGDGAKKLRTSSGALRKPEAEQSPRLCDQLPSKHPSRDGPHYWPRQPKLLLQPVSRRKTRQPTPAQMAKPSPWAPSSSTAPPPPRPRHPASLYDLEGAPPALDLCQTPSGPALGQRKLCVRFRTPFRPSCGKKERAEKKIDTTCFFLKTKNEHIQKWSKMKIIFLSGIYLLEL